MLHDPSRQLIQDWAQKISATHRKSLKSIFESIFEVGDVLIAAKKDITQKLGHGRWLRMWEPETKTRLQLPS